MIYHLAPADRWNNWPLDTDYLPAEFDADGFVHCTAGDDLMLRVANTFYRQVAEPFVLLVIDTDLLKAPLKWEESNDELRSLFPHIYGPINRDAVVEVRPARRAESGEFLGW
jgi:uncharacterized protein (DUF952 family)